MGQHRVLQQAAGALGGDAAEDVVLGDVVRAHGEHLHAVDLVAEGFAPFVLFPADGQRPQADAPLPHAAGNLRPNGIQRLPAIAVGPPQMGEIDHDVLAAAVPGLPVGGGDGDGNLRVPFQLRAEAQRHPARLMLLLHQHAEDAGRVHKLQLDIAPDARVGQPGPPVPAEHAVGLAQVGIAGNCVGGAPAGAFLIGGKRSLHGGVEVDEQAVAPGVEQRLHIPIPGNVHVVGIADRLPVDGYKGQGVQPVAMQQNAPGAQLILRQVKVAGIFVVMAQKLEGAALVFPPEGILHLTLAQQVGVDRARNPGLQPRAAIGLTHAPRAVQG